MRVRNHLYRYHVRTPLFPIHLAPKNGLTKFVTTENMEDVRIEIKE